MPTASPSARGTPGSNFGARRSQGLLLFIVVILITGIFVSAGDLREFARLLGRSDWSLLPPALLLTAVSYGCVSAALVALGGPMGVSAPVLPMFRIAVLSVAVNNLVSFGGVAGYSLRVALSRPHGVSTGRSLALSLTHAYLNNLVMFMLLAVVLVRLVDDSAIDERWQATIAAAGVAAGGFVVLSTAALFSGQVRGVIVWAIGRVSRKFMAGLGVKIGSALEELDEALGRAASAFRRRPAEMWLPIALLCVHWASMAGAFWACARAFSADLDGSTVVSGFSIGAVAGFASLLPGGLGVQEGSQAAVLTLQDVPLEVAVLAALLFRVVYYVTPFLLTMPLFAWLLRRREGGGGAASNGVGPLE